MITLADRWSAGADWREPEVVKAESEITSHGTTFYANRCDYFSADFFCFCSVLGVLVGTAPPPILSFIELSRYQLVAVSVFHRIVGRKRWQLEEAAPEVRQDDSNQVPLRWVIANSFLDLIDYWICLNQLSRCFDWFGEANWKLAWVQCGEIRRQSFLIGLYQNKYKKYIKTRIKNWELQ